MLYIILFSILILFFIIGIYWAYNQEKKDWNNGYCSYCYSQWKYFDIDSHRSRGYTCQCGRYIWISYSIDKFPVYSS